MIDYIFFEHPRKNNMTYLQHFCFSANLSFLFFAAGFQALLHSIFPCLVQTSSTDTQRVLNMFMDSHED